MEESNLTLYFFDGSFYTQKVRLYLAEKEIKYNEHRLDRINKEMFAPWFMKINPKGQVPVLKDGDKIITESTDIMYYLENKFKNTRCMDPGSDTELGKKIEYFQTTLDSIKIEGLSFGTALFPNLVKNSELPEFVRQYVAKTITDNEFEKTIKTMMEKAPADMREVYQKKLEMNASRDMNHVTEESLRVELDKIDDMFDEIEHQLSKAVKAHPNKETWLLSDQFLMVDVTLAVTLRRFKMIGLSERYWGPGSSRPLLCNYYSQLLNRETFKYICLNKFAMLLHMFIPMFIKQTKAFLTSWKMLTIAAVGVGASIWWYNKYKK